MFLFFIPIWVIVMILIGGFVFGKMVIEGITSFLGVVFAIIIGVIIVVQVVKGIRRIIDDNDSSDDWSWEDN